MVVAKSLDIWRFVTHSSQTVQATFGGRSILATILYGFSHNNGSPVNASKHNHDLILRMFWWLVVALVIVGVWRPLLSLIDWP